MVLMNEPMNKPDEILKDVVLAVFERLRTTDDPEFNADSVFQYPAECIMKELQSNEEFSASYEVQMVIISPQIFTESGSPEIKVTMCYLDNTNPKGSLIKTGLIKTNLIFGFGVDHDPEFN